MHIVDRDRYRQAKEEANPRYVIGLIRVADTQEEPMTPLVRATYIHSARSVARAAPRMVVIHGRYQSMGEMCPVLALLRRTEVMATVGGGGYP